VRSRVLVMVAVMQARIVRVFVQKRRVSIPASMRIPGGVGWGVVVLVVVVMHMAMLMLTEVLVCGEQDQSSG
jgi:hypothetical protein